MLVWYSSRTNEINVKLKYESSGDPLTGATVTIELIDNRKATQGVVQDSGATLQEVSGKPGTYYKKYPILANVTKGVQFSLHIVVQVGGNTVIDEIIDQPVQGL